MNDKFKTININLFGAPGSGKSTMMASLFSKLKMNGIDVEMAPEYVKRKVWENSIDVLDDQVYVFGKQYHTMNILQGKVQVVITDSPLLLSMYYVDQSDVSVCTSGALKALALSAHNDLLNWNILLNRVKPYNPNGRMQTEIESDLIHLELGNILFNHGIKYSGYAGNEHDANQIAEQVVDWLSDMTPVEHSGDLK